MPTLLLQAFRWAGTAALGWVGKDFMDWFSADEQTEPATTVVTSNWKKWLFGSAIVAVIAFVVLFMYKKLKK